MSIEELRALEAAATLGPWWHYGSWPFEVHDPQPDEGDSRQLFVAGREGNEPDAAFIAAARNMLPDLLDEVEALRAKVAAVEALIPAECWVTRSASPLRCTAMIGGGFENGAKWTDEMCCLPCRLRAALDVPSGEGADS